MQSFQLGQRFTTTGVPLNGGKAYFYDKRPAGYIKQRTRPPANRGVGVIHKRGDGWHCQHLGEPPPPPTIAWASYIWH